MKHDLILKSLALGIAACLTLSVSSVHSQSSQTTVSFKSYNAPDRYIRHKGLLGFIDPINSDLGRKDASFNTIPGLADSNCSSFESVNFPNHFLRHEGMRLKVSRGSDQELFKKDATFCTKPGLANSNASSFESFNAPGHYIRHKNFELWLDRSDGSNLFMADSTFNIVTALTSQGTSLPPEISGTLQGPNNKKSMGGGYAEAEATFYRNGLVIIPTHSVSRSFTNATKGSVFVVGSDTRGRALFASPVFDIPTACSRADTCSSNRRDTIQHQINSELAKYVAKIDVYVNDRSIGRSARQAFNTTITETCGSYDDLPVAARAAIAAETGFPGCGPR